MRQGLAYSAGLHALLALIMIGVFPSIAPELPPLPPNIPIDLVTIGEINNVKKIDKVDEPKPEVKPAEPEPEPMRQAALPPTPEPTPAPEPVPAPVPPPQEVKPAPAPEKKVEEKKPEPKPEVKPQPPAPPKKKEPAFDASKIAALLNKIPTKDKSTQPGPQKQLATGPQKTEAVGEASDMTANYQALISSQFTRCWNQDLGAKGAESFIVVVHVELNPDGSLSSQPYIENQAAVDLGGPGYQVAAQRALRAVRVCNPLRMLPADRYSEWREGSYRFDPRAMAGG